MRESTEETPQRTLPFDGLVFIGTSVDGYIARADGDLEWLTSRGEQAGDTGYDDFIAEVDTVVLGRNTYQQVLRFDEWPYGQRAVHVVSTSLGGQDPRVTVHRTIDALVGALAAAGAKRVYLDGGTMIQSCLERGLVTELTITTVPVLIGGGAPLFGALAHDIDLAHIRTTVLPAGLVQTTYRCVAS